MREKGRQDVPVCSSHVGAIITPERALLIGSERFEQQIGFLRRDPPIGDHAQNGGALIFERRTGGRRSLLRRLRLRRFIGGCRGIGRLRDVDPDRCAGRRFGRVRRSGWVGRLIHDLFTFHTCDIL